MATLTTKIVSRLKALGIDTTDEKIARKKLLAILKKNEVPDCDEDPIDSLIEMCSVFSDAAGEEEAEEEETEVEEVEEEAPAPKKKSAKPAPAPVKKGAKKVVPVVEEVDEEEELDELVDEVKDKDLKTTPAKPVKKVEAKKTTEHKRKLMGTRWLDLTDQQKEKALLPFRKLFPKDKYAIGVLQQSFTVTFLGKTSKQNIFKYHLLRLLENGKLEGVFVSHRFKEPTEFAEYLDESLVTDRTLKQGDSCSYIHPLGQDEVMELLKDTDFLSESVKRAQQQDKKMQANRENLEKTLTEGGTKKKPENKKVTVVVVDTDEEGEEEEEAPAPKKVAAKTAVAAKGTTKVVKKPAPAEVLDAEDELEEEEEPAPAPKKKVAAKKK